MFCNTDLQFTCVGSYTAATHDGNKMTRACGYTTCKHTLWHFTKNNFLIFLKSDFQIWQGANGWVCGCVQCGPQVSQGAATVPGQHRGPVWSDIGQRTALCGHPGQPAPCGVSGRCLQRFPHCQVSEVVGPEGTCIFVYTAVHTKKEKK